MCMKYILGVPGVIKEWQCGIRWLLAGKGLNPEYKFAAVASPYAQVGGQCRLHALNPSARPCVSCQGNKTHDPSSNSRLHDLTLHMCSRPQLHMVVYQRSACPFLLSPTAAANPASLSPCLLPFRIPNPSFHTHTLS